MSVRPVGNLSPRLAQEVIALTAGWDRCHHERVAKSERAGRRRVRWSASSPEQPPNQDADDEPRRRRGGRLSRAAGQSPKAAQASVRQRVRAYAFGLAVWLPIALLVIVALEWINWPSWPVVPAAAGFAAGTAEHRLEQG